MTLAPRQVLAGRYRLQHVLAKGGMGAVWVAEELLSHRLLAVKVMDPEVAASEDGHPRFLREARAASQLRSPHIVAVHDYGVEQGNPFMVMDLLQGEDLESVLRRDLRLAPARLARILVHVCKGLELAHDAGIVHRDLKPANIYLSQEEGQEVAKILDFGIAKAKDAKEVGHATKTGTLIGSPHYMSPEQARRSKDVDHRSDLWALGVVVFRALTGKLPFPGSELGDIIVKICAEPIPAPSAVAPDVGHGADRFLERALSRDPEKRFQSARSMAETFAVLVGAPIRWDDPLNVPIPAPRASRPSGEAPASAAAPAPPAPSEARVIVRLGAARNALGGPADSQGTLSPAGQSVRQSPEGVPRAAIGLLAIGLLAILAGSYFTWTRGGTAPPAPASEEPARFPAEATASASTAPPSAPAPAPAPSSRAVVASASAPPAAPPTSHPSANPAGPKAPTKAPGKPAAKHDPELGI